MGNRLSIMPFSALSRKIELMHKQISMTRIAEETGTDKGFVSHVVAGRKWESRRAPKVMQRVAEIIGAPIGEVFPGAERRTGEDRRQAS